MIQSSPSRTARVRIPATSDPASGSVMAMAAIFSPRMAGSSQRRFCSSVPNSWIGGVAMSVCTPSAIGTPPKPARPSSSPQTTVAQ